MLRPYILLALCITGTSCASEKCIPQTDEDPALCPLALPAITSIEIVHAGIKDPAQSQDPVDCSSFHLDEAQVRRYLTHAKRVDEIGFHRLDWSPCSADGVAKFADGKVLHWTINLSRAGSLASEPKAPKYWRNLYCPDCDFPPFAKR